MCVSMQTLPPLHDSLRDLQVCQLRDDVPLPLTQVLPSLRACYAAAKSKAKAKGRGASGRAPQEGALSEGECGLQL